MRQTSSYITDAGAFASIGLVTVKWASTTSQSVAFLSAIRLSLILFVLLVLLYGIIKAPSKFRSIFVGGFVVALLAIYSNLALGIWAPRADVDTPTVYFIWVGLSSAIAGIFYLSPVGQPIISNRVVWMYIFFAVVILLYTIAQGGFVLNGFPRFVFTLINTEGRGLHYSQGVSKFYGLAAVFSALLVSQPTSSRKTRIMCVGLLVLFLALSLLGGGRGDFLVALLLSLLALRFVYFALLVGLVFAALILAPDLLDGLTTKYSFLFDRYAAFSYSLGARDLLLADSAILLTNEPVCLFFGCGIGFFQNYYGYRAGLYPHNVPVEFIISYGLLITIGLVYLIAKGLKVMRQRYGKSPYFAFFFLFYLLISLKSGQLLTSYLLFGAVLFLVQLGLKPSALNRKQIRRQERMKGA